MKAQALATLMFLAALCTSGQTLAQSVPRQPILRRVPHGGQPENRWRYQWHNDRWWYWTTDAHWSVFDGQRWVNYDGRVASLMAFAGGYRKAHAFQSPPAAPPQPPRTWSAEVRREAGMANSYYPGGITGATGTPLEGSRSPALSGLNVSPGGDRSSAGKGSGAIEGAPRTGGGAFGGPRGRSLGAGSAAGGASTPQ